MDATKKRAPNAPGDAASTKRARPLDDDVDDADIMDAELFGANYREEFIPEDDDLVLRPSGTQQDQYRPRFRYARPSLPPGGIDAAATNLGTGMTPSSQCLTSIRSVSAAGGRHAAGATPPRARRRHAPQRRTHHAPLWSDPGR